jgi:hypothetical protein
MSKCGFYQVGDKQFNNKNHAIYEASTTKSKMSWNFYDSVFDDFAKTKLKTLGQLPLDAWYKLRAHQLRDTYDYLILNYSGGPDSHNILMTFLNNNIKLDEVHVKYSSTVDSKIYIPNTTIFGAENIHSEWDYVIKPTLDKLSVTNPEIKIDIHDVFQDKLIINDDTLLNAPSHFLGAFELKRQQSYSKSVDIESDKGHRVADIYGIDKPVIIYKEKSFFMVFNDVTVSVGGNRHPNIELFYWTPDMPQIPFEQAYKLYLHFKENPNLLSLIDVSVINRGDSLRLETLRKLSIDLIYNTWDHNKFQADKPVYYSKEGRTRDKYYLAHADFSKYLDIWNYHAHSWNSALSTQYFNNDLIQSEMLFSKWHNIGYFI